MFTSKFEDNKYEYKGVWWRPFKYYELPYPDWKYSLCIHVNYKKPNDGLFLAVRKMEGTPFTYLIPNKCPSMDHDIKLPKVFTEVERLAIFAETGVHIPPVQLRYDSLLMTSTIELYGY